MNDTQVNITWTCRNCGATATMTVPANQISQTIYDYDLEHVNQGCRPREASIRYEEVKK